MESVNSSEEEINDRKEGGDIIVSHAERRRIANKKVSRAVYKTTILY